MKFECKKLDCLLIVSLLMCLDKGSVIAQNCTPYTTPNDSILVDGTLPPTGANVRLNNLNPIVEPFPRVIAGTPISYSYAPNTNIFSFTYSAKRADGCGCASANLETEIFVPQRNYPNGYTVQVTGGVVTSKANSGLLLIKRNKEAKQVAVVVSPR